METCLSSSPEVRCRHRGLEGRRNARWQGAASPEYLPVYGASCPSSFCPHHSHADRCRPPFFGAFHALAIDDGSGGAGFSLRLLAACDVEHMVNAIQNPIAVPPHEVVVDRAVGRKVLRKVAPLATGAQDIHHFVHDRTHVGPPLATAGLGWRNQWCNIGPLFICEVARVPQMITIVFRPGLKRPHP